MSIRDEIPTADARSAASSDIHPKPSVDLPRRVAQLTRSGRAMLQTNALSWGIVVIRLGVALVFCWFGALKVAGMSPVAPLLAATFPWVDSHLLATGLGVVEVVLGLAIIGWPGSVLPALVAIGHLTGTFVTFVLAPERMFLYDNPLLITTEGEFVTKNVILIGALLVLVGLRIAPYPRH